MMRSAAAAALAALLAAPANAQQPTGDWDLIVDEREDMMLAAVGYSSGQTIAVRCRADDLEVLVSGLPPIEGQTRRIEAAYSDARVDGGLWFTSGDGSLVFSPVPRMDARRLRQSGPLQLSVAVGPEPETPLRRYALDLPARSANLDRVLEACSAGQNDPRDDLVRWIPPPGSNLWKPQPTPHYPPAAINLGGGFAVIGCIAAADGRLEDCRVERESHHRRYGFGEAAVRSMRNARLAPPAEGGPRPGQLVISTIRFRIA